MATHLYTIIYRRTMEIEAEEQMGHAELMELARESLHDESALWSVSWDFDRWYALR